MGLLDGRVKESLSPQAASVWWMLGAAAGIASGLLVGLIGAGVGGGSLAAMAAGAAIWAAVVSVWSWRRSRLDRRPRARELRQGVLVMAWVVALMSALFAATS